MRRAHPREFGRHRYGLLDQRVTANILPMHACLRSASACPHKRDGRSPGVCSRVVCSSGVFSSEIFRCSLRMMSSSNEASSSVCAVTRWHAMTVHACHRCSPHAPSERHRDTRKVATESAVDNHRHATFGNSHSAAPIDVMLEKRHSPARNVLIPCSAFSSRPLRMRSAVTVRANDVLELSLFR